MRSVDLFCSQDILLAAYRLIVYFIAAINKCNSVIPVQGNEPLPVDINIVATRHEMASRFCVCHHPPAVTRAAPPLEGSDSIP